MVEHSQASMGLGGTGMRKYLIAAPVNPPQPVDFSKKAWQLDATDAYF